MNKLLYRNEEGVQSLKSEVEAAFGRAITSYRDCVLLSEEIYIRTSFKINLNTLRRFFGIVKAEYPPSLGTLNILSKYCGFDSVEEFLHANTNQKENGLENVHADEILSYIISLFKSTIVKDYNDETFLNLVKHTIQFLQKHPALTDGFQRAIARIKNGQDYYFEQFINIDALNSFYGDGLRYYLNEKKTVEAQVFGHSLLCFRAWLTDNCEEVVKQYDEVMKYSLHKFSNPFVCGRYYATQLYYATTRGLDTNKVLAEAFKVHSSMKPEKQDNNRFPGFEYILSTSLLLTGHYDDASYYSDYALINYPEQHNYVEAGFYQTLLLTKAITLVIRGRKMEAARIHELIKPSAFYFLTRKINTIMYIYLSKLLGRNNPKWDQQLKELIKETGFLRLSTIVGYNVLSS